MKELKSGIKDFVNGGNSIFTVQNNDTGNRYTFRVKKSKDNISFVSFLNGTDNYSNYNYIGIINKNNIFKHTKNSRVNKDSTVFKSFRWFWNRCNQGENFPENFRFYHEGRCAKCGRKLTTPKSIERGFGAVCYDSIR